MKKLGVSKVVSVERKPLTGCPSGTEIACGINYRAYWVRSKIEVTHWVTSFILDSKFYFLIRGNCYGKSWR